MLEKSRLIDALQVYFAVFQVCISRKSKMGLVDDNILGEDFIACLLNQLYGWDLENLNSKRSNVSGVDLLDSGRRIGVQVTAKRTSKKVNDTLMMVNKDGWRAKFDRLFIFMLVKKQEKYSITVTCPGVQFSNSSILSFETILEEANSASVDTFLLKKIYDIVVRNFNSLPPDFVPNGVSFFGHQGLNGEVITQKLDELLDRSLEAGSTAKAKVVLLLEKGAISEALSTLDEYAERVSGELVQEFFDIANLYSSMGSDKAEIYFRQAIDLNPDSIKEANLYGLQLMKNGRLTEAEEVFKACLEKAEIQPNEKEALWGNLGVLYKNKSMIDLALHALEHAAEIAVARNNLRGLACHLNNIGGCYNDCWDFEKSEKNLNNALALIDELIANHDDVGVKNESRLVKSNIFTNMAIRLRRLGEQTQDPELRQERVAILKKAIEIAELLHADVELSRHYGNLSSAYREIGDLRQSSRYLDKAYNLSVKNGDLQAQIVGLINKAQLNVAEDELKTARSCLEEGVSIEAGKYPKLGASLYANLSLVCRDLGDLKSASEFFRIGYDLYVSIGDSGSAQTLRYKFFH